MPVITHQCRYWQFAQKILTSTSRRMNFPFSVLLFRLLLKGSSTQTWDFKEVGGKHGNQSYSQNTYGSIYSLTTLRTRPSVIQCQTGTHSNVTRWQWIWSNPIYIFQRPPFAGTKKPTASFQFHLFLTFFLLVYQISLWKPKWKSLWFRQKLPSPL